MTITHKNLVIRADADTRTGTGHVMRCIALAQAWQDRGGDVTFLSRCDSKALRQRIIDEGCNFISIEKQHPHPSDLHSTLEGLSAISRQPSTASPWLVLDGYHFTPDYQKAIRKNGYRLLVIDDMAHQDHYHADMLLNQNIHAPSLNYSCDGETVKLLGCEYALLRREFLKYKDWKREIPDKAKKILVTMGGSDPDNVTLKVIRALNSLNNPDLEVKIVIGSVNPNTESLRKELLCSPFTVHHLPDVSNMPELMAWADVAVSAAGSTCWELAFMGLPSLIITVADNQAGIAEGLDKAGTAIDSGWHENISIKQYVQALKEILQDKNKRSRFSEQGQKLVNGKGRQKIIRAMLAGQIKLRRAQENDCELLWKWANDTAVRQAAFNSKNIAWEDHLMWFSDKRSDSNCIQYIALNSHDVPIGQIRFDIKDLIVEVDYSIDKDFREMGLGKILLKRGIGLFCAEEEKTITIQRCVKRENEPSNRAVQGVGFLGAGEKAIDENDVTNTHTHRLSITILSDKESWINAYIPNLISEFVLLGHTVVWEHNVSQIKEGDIVFCLGCGQIVPPDILSRNKYNLVVHESALPRGKGWSPLTWQILEGKNEIPITLFEAEKSVDSGKIYIRDTMHFNGTELVEELRQKQAEYTIKMCVSFVEGYPGIISRGTDQSGKSSYYKKRGPDDSRFDPDKTIREQFNLLRVVDNERYPAYFELDGARYLLKVEKG